MPKALKSSDEVYSYKSLNNIYFYDVSNFIEDDFNCFDIIYTTSSGCNIDVSVFNFKTSEWDRISSSPGARAMCSGAFTDHYRIFPQKGCLNSDDYLDNFKIMKLKGVNGKIRALKVNEDYYSIPLPGIMSADGLTWDGEYFWITSNFKNKIFRLDRKGNLIKSFNSTNEWPLGLAWDGKFLYNADGSDNIYKLDVDGNQIGSFSVSTDYPGGLTFDGEAIWLSEYQGPDLRIFKINLKKALEDGNISNAIIKSFRSPGGGSWGLAFDGENILISGNKGYKVNKEGDIIGTFSIPINNPGDITWDGEYLWVIGYGPKDGRRKESSVSLSRINID
jgi:hypothetical protein